MPKSVDSAAVEPVLQTFAQLGLSAALVAKLTARSITTPTPIQAGIIPHALLGGDLLAQARTGSGKTLAFLLPLVERIMAKEIQRVWVVCPTRELAQQTAREAETLLGPGRCAVLVGGVPSFPQIRDLRKGPVIVVGTPGRMCDHLSQGNLKPDAEIVVLDEADQMLDMGFSEDLERLVKDLGQSVARWLFSATFPRNVQDAVNRWLDKPREVRLDQHASTNHVTQKFVCAKPGAEMAALSRLLHILEPQRALVFVRTREDVDRTVRTIAADNIEAAGISGDLSQEARERVLERFRTGRLAVLVGTDVAARGIDVPGVSHVFNLGLPMNAQLYTHRIGRTARAGAEGEAWTVIGPYDRSRFQRMTSIAKCRPEEVPLPAASAIIDAKRQRLAKRVQDTLGEKVTLPASFAPLVKEYGADVVLASLIHRLIPDAPIEKTPDRSAAPARQANGPAGKGRFDNGPKSTGSNRGSGDARPVLGRDGTVSLFIGLGIDDGINPGTLVALLCHQRGLQASDIGRIRFFAHNCLVGVSPGVVDGILAHPLHHRGVPVAVRLDHGGREKH